MLNYINKVPKSKPQKELSEQKDNSVKNRAFKYIAPKQGSSHRQMVNKHIKRCLAMLVIEGKHIENYNEGMKVQGLQPNY